MGKLQITHKYDDIIGLSHPVSERRPGMRIGDRAAQFAPFAALTGYDGVIAETGRLTDTCIELDECAKEMLNGKLLELLEKIGQKPPVRVTYFCPDKRKSGGAYVAVTGNLKRIDPIERLLLLTDGTVIPIDRIYRLGEDISD